MQILVLLGLIRILIMLCNLNKLKLLHDKNSYTTTTVLDYCCRGKLTDTDPAVNTAMSREIALLLPSSLLVRLVTGLGDGSERATWLDLQPGRGE